MSCVLKATSLFSDNSLGPPGLLVYLFLPRSPTHSLGGPTAATVHSILPAYAMCVRPGTSSVCGLMLCSHELCAKGHFSISDNSLGPPALLVYLFLPRSPTHSLAGPTAATVHTILPKLVALYDLSRDIWHKLSLRLVALVAMSCVLKATSLFLTTS